MIMNECTSTNKQRTTLPTMDLLSLRPQTVFLSYSSSTCWSLLSWDQLHSVETNSLLTIAFKKEIVITITWIRQCFVSLMLNRLSSNVCVYVIDLRGNGYNMRLVVVVVVVAACVHLYFSQQFIRRMILQFF